MPRLHYFTTSPFSRRVRLAILHKGVEVALVDARTSPSHLEEMKSLWPMRTAPILVTDDGRVIGDSTAIVHYLDAAYPNAPRAFPTDAAALTTTLQVTTLVDGALETLVNLGTRYYSLRSDAAWKTVTAEMLGRAQAALDALGERVDESGLGPLTAYADGWCAADMWLYTMVAWLEALPARKGTNQNVDQILTLPWTVPASLRRWAEAHAARADVRALG